MQCLEREKKKKMCTTKHEATSWIWFFFFFKEQSCTDVVKIQPPTPAEFCVNPMDNSTIFGILKLGAGIAQWL